MNLYRTVRQVIILLALIPLVNSVTAAETFTIEDIRVVGLQRLTPGTVFNYLPVEVGDTFTDQISVQAARALFGTGFFDDVRLERDGNVLVIKVKERPAIGSIEISGNEDIKTEDLMDGLKGVGFTEGRVFDQSQLDKLEKELQRQYFSRGKYGVKIQSTVESLSNNRVAVSIDIAEGEAARIRQINIVGNEAFDDDDLLDEFELSSRSLFSFFTKKDQYSKQKLSGDLETLRSLYLDHGYINFSIDSTQVSITPDKKDIYITINVTEGEQYTVSGVKLAGELVLSEEELFKLVTVKKGSLFSRKDTTDTTTAITDALGSDGYAFANVNSIPNIDNENKEVEITFFVDPGKRAYVRRITFSGNTRTRDEVLRREMRQLEGGWISTPKVERGKVRLQRLGYFKDVNVETPAVAGTPDLVDVQYSVEEQPFGNFMIGLGFSQTSGLIFQTSITQNNFLGSGRRMQFAFSNSKINRRFSVGYMNPYYTIDGISRGFNLNYQETDAFDANIVDFNSRVYGGGVSFSIPISEYNSISTSFNYENTKLGVGLFGTELLRQDIDKCNPCNIYRVNVGFNYDTRNKTVLPEDGFLHSIGGEVAVPLFGDTREFYKLFYRTQWYFPIFNDFIFAVKGEFGYGEAFGDDNLPIFENFYAGGPRSVRGYEENTLGPRVRGRPLGGNIKIIGGAEFIIPIPFLDEFKESVRMSAFFDAGNVFGDYGPDINNEGLVNEPFDMGNLRYSAGLSGIWVSPFGLVSISIATPIGSEPGDETQRFQFNFGTNF